MAIEIDGMEMPKSCAHCRKFVRASTMGLIVCSLTKNIVNESFDSSKRDPGCPLRERQTGRWIRITTGRIKEAYMCSECHRQIEADEIELSIRYPYCHCGAKMEGSE